MKVIQRVASDIRQGENLDLYVTIPAAIVISILNLVGILPANLIAPITLLVLGFITITLLGTGYRVERLAEKLTPSVDSIFLEKFPPDLDEDVIASPDVWFVGVTLSKPAKDLYSIIEEKLRKGHSIKVLITHPDPNVVGFQKCALMTVPMWNAPVSTLAGDYRTFAISNALTPIKWRFAPSCTRWGMELLV